MQNEYIFAQAELFRPGRKRADNRKLIVLHALGGSDQAGVAQVRIFENLCPFVLPADRGERYSALETVPRLQLRGIR